MAEQKQIKVTREDQEIDTEVSIKGVGRRGENAFLMTHTTGTEKETKTNLTLVKDVRSRTKKKRKKEGCDQPVLETNRSRKK